MKEEIIAEAKKRYTCGTKGVSVYGIDFEVSNKEPVFYFHSDGDLHIEVLYGSEFTVYSKGRWATIIESE